MRSQGKSWTKGVVGTWRRVFVNPGKATASDQEGHVGRVTPLTTAPSATAIPRRLATDEQVKELIRDLAAMNLELAIVSAEPGE